MQYGEIDKDLGLFSQGKTGPVNYQGNTMKQTNKETKIIFEVILSYTLEYRITVSL